jgi:hypothetical protein
VATRLQVAHRIIALLIGLAVPLAVYLVNGTIDTWAFVLGAVAGSTYWYFVPDPPPA